MSASQPISDRLKTSTTFPWSTPSVTGAEGGARQDDPQLDEFLAAGGAVTLLPARFAVNPPIRKKLAKKWKVWKRPRRRKPSRRRVPHEIQFRRALDKEATRGIAPGKGPALRKGPVGSA